MHLAAIGCAAQFQIKQYEIFETCLASDKKDIIMEAQDYVAGYQQLAALGVGFYPIHADKSPAVSGRLNRAATIDPIKIRFWYEHRQHRSFAARILRESRLMVVDTEHPFKHPDQPGPDGEMVLGSLLEDSETTLPACPMVQTGSGGFHRYMVVPNGFRIRPAVALWPGIDILATGSSVILPGSRTEAGEYRTIRSFNECSIPEAPRSFLNLIRSNQKARPNQRPADLCTFIEADTPEVSKRHWWLLFRNRVFRSFWRRQGKAGDSTDSAYEFHLAKACFCCGLNHRQAEFVIMNWRRKHRLNRDARKLRASIIPSAWSEVGPWVKLWRGEREAAERAKKANKTANLILINVRDTGTPQTPASIAAALNIPRETAKKAMQRMAAAGKLARTPAGYISGESMGTF